MNKSQQFILSEHLEDIKDALEFTKFLVTEKSRHINFARSI